MGELFKKNWLKIFVAIFIFSLATSFMFFVYEPVVMYANNVNDFWFDISLLLQESSILIYLSFLAVFAALIIAWIICKKINKINIFYALYSLCCFGFVYFYIHGNYLAGFLPVLNGESIDWDNLLIPDIISVILFVMLIVGFIFIIVKHKERSCAKASFFAICAIIFMLSTSLVTTLMSSDDVFVKKDVVAYPTFKNLETLSTEENFLILTLDAVDSTTFNKLINSSDSYSDLLKDFTYYPDTLSSYLFSMEEVVLILTGEKFETSDKNFQDFSTDAFNNSRLLNTLTDYNYLSNIYVWDGDLTWHDRKALEVDNLSIGSQTDNNIFIRQELKYILFKYLPFQLKKYSNIESMDFGLAKISDDNYEKFSCDNKVVYDYLATTPVNLTDKKYFQYLHIQGGHPPFVYDEYLNPIEDGTYEQKVLSSLKVVDLYLERLKEAGVYDKTTIVLMADHGYNGDELLGRQNPILYIKSKNTTQDKTTVSAKSVSHDDLVEAFTDLIEGKDTADLFASSSSDKKRTHIVYSYWEREATEYYATGKAWETEKLVPTGNEYDL